jgi:hypothetical protein
MTNRGIGKTAMLAARLRFQVALTKLWKDRA